VNQVIARIQSRRAPAYKTLSPAQSQIGSVERLRNATNLSMTGSYSLTRGCQ